MMRWVPGWRAWVFSVRTFAAAMLALYVGLALDLQRPYWAMATVYIVSQPLSGATRSKALYRFIGTLLGAAAAIAMIPNLVDAPVVLSLAFTAWTGLCLYFALHDRTPRSYMFLLAGYSAGIIGFPTVDTPDRIFDIALARVEEISLGILCATVVASAVVPTSVAPMLAARVRAWIDSVIRWSQDALSGLPETETTRADRRRMAADLAEIDTLTLFLAWDASASADAAPWVLALRRRLVILLPVLSSVADRVQALRQIDAISPSLRTLLRDMSAWVEAGRDAPRLSDIGLRQEIEAQFPDLQESSDWAAMLRASLVLRLRELDSLVQDCRDLRRHIATGGGRFTGVLAYNGTRAAAAARHRDPLMAIWSGLAAALATLFCCWFWIATAWPAGSSAPMMATVACCFFAAQDDPVPSLVKFVLGAFIAVSFDAFYLFVILPRVEDFGMLVLALAPGFLLVGAFIATPAMQAFGSSVAVISATLLSLQSTYNANFADFVNGSTAIIFGLIAAAVVIALVRSVGAAWSAHRLLKAGWRDVANAAASYGNRDRAVFAGLMLDRIALLAPRMAVAGSSGTLDSVDVLTDLRVGLNVVDLRRARRRLAEPVRRRVEAVLSLLAAFYRQRIAEPEVVPSARLLDSVDSALAAVAAGPDGGGRNDALMGLVGIRRGLFPTAPAYESPVVPVEMETV